MQVQKEGNREVKRSIDHYNLDMIIALGYIVTNNDISYYVAGDKTEKSESIKCDIAFIPIGGYYTMDVNDTVELAKIINPKVVIPIHYDSIIGSREDGLNLKEKLNNTNIGVLEKIIFN